MLDSLFKWVGRLPEYAIVLAIITMVVFTIGLREVKSDKTRASPGESQALAIGEFSQSDGTYVANTSAQEFGGTATIFVIRSGENGAVATVRIVDKTFLTDAFTFYSFDSVTFLDPADFSVVVDGQTLLVSLLDESTLVNDDNVISNAPASNASHNGLTSGLIASQDPTVLAAAILAFGVITAVLLVLFKDKKTARSSARSLTRGISNRGLGGDLCLPAIMLALVAIMFVAGLNAFADFDTTALASGFAAVIVAVAAIAFAGFDKNPAAYAMVRKDN